MRSRPLALGLLAGALFGLSTPASKLLLQDLPPPALAGLLYLGAALATAWPALRQPWGKVPRADVHRLAGALLLGGVVGPLLLLAGLQRASAADVSMWLNLELAFTALFGVLLFRDHLGGHGWLAVALVIGAGAWLTGASHLPLAAAGLVAAACAAWALDNHWTALVGGLRPEQSTFLKGLTGAAVNLGVAVAAGWSPAASAAAAGAVAVGTLGYGASIVLSIQAAQGSGATRAQLAFSTAPLWGLLGAAVALGERLTWRHAAAVALVAAAVTLLHRDRHSHEHVHEAMAHTHSHRHDDGHHTHLHPGLPPWTRHTHWHEHERVVHTHPHWPDLHHRHRHP